MPTTVAVDVGSTQVKAIVVAPDGEILARGAATLSTDRPRPNWVEQDPEDWWRATVDAVRQCGELAAKASVLAVTGQMQDLVLVDGDTHLGPAILYSDQRPEAEHTIASEKIGVRWWHDVTGNEQDSSNLLAKLMWVRTAWPDNYGSARWLLPSAHAYVVWRATGVAACDRTTASTTGLLDLGAREWKQEFLTTLGLRADLLPPLVTGHEVVGTVREDVTDELGMRAGTPVVLAPGDALTTTVGMLGDRTGDAYAYLGTSGWVAAVRRSGDTALAAASHRLAHTENGLELTIAAMLHVGACGDWARSTLLDGAAPAAADALVTSAGHGPTGLLFLPSLAGERAPVRSTDATGVFVGITPATDAVALYRGVLEGVAYSLRAAAEVLLENRPLPSVLPVCGGGASSRPWRHIIADVMGRPVAWLGKADAAALGAAAAAAHALGHEPPPSLLNRAEGLVEPSPASDRYQELFKIHRGLFQTLTPTFAALRRVGL